MSCLTDRTTDPTAAGARAGDTFNAHRSHRRHLSLGHHHWQRREERDHSTDKSGIKSSRQTGDIRKSRPLSTWFANFMQQHQQKGSVAGSASGCASGKTRQVDKATTTTMAAAPLHIDAGRNSRKLKRSTWSPATAASQMRQSAAMTPSGSNAQRDDRERERGKYKVGIFFSRSFAETTDFLSIRALPPFP